MASAAKPIANTQPQSGVKTTKTASGKKPASGEVKPVFTDFASI